MNGKEFLGQGLKFPLQVDPKTGKFAMVSQEEDIQEAIRILLYTTQGERVMRPEFGSNVVDYTFSAPSSAMMQSVGSVFLSNAPAASGGSEVKDSGSKIRRTVRDHAV